MVKCLAKAAVLTCESYTSQISCFQPDASAAALYLLAVLTYLTVHNGVLEAGSLSLSRVIAAGVVVECRSRAGVQTLVRALSGGSSVGHCDGLVCDCSKM